MINSLLLMSGNDVPFQQAELVIHQPTLDQISFIGQETFFVGCEYLSFSKQILEKEQDKEHLSNLNDFEVLMMIIQNNDIAVKKIKTCMELVLLLLFPTYKISFLPKSIMLTKKVDDTIQRRLIDENNFLSFKKIITQIFCLTEMVQDETKYNPGGPQAKALVQKFKKRQKTLARLKNQNNHAQKRISILSQKLSILEIGMRLDINTLLQYTIYQLYDAFERFRLKDSFDLYVQAKMAGAKDLEEIENWMGDIHSDTL